MEIKQCTAENAQELALVVATTWQTAYDGILPPSVIDTERTRLRIEHLGFYYANGLQNNWFEAFLMEENAINIGGFIMGPSKDQDADLSVAEIMGIYIVGGYRHQGYGSLALQFIEARLREQRYTNATLWVLEDNERPIKFYRKHGYEQDGATRSVAISGNLQELRFTKAL